MSDPIPLKAAQGLRARFKNRDPDPGELLVRSIDWEKGKADVTNGATSYFPDLDELEITHVKGLHLLDPFLGDLDPAPTDAMELAEEIYKRVRLAYDIRRVAESSSWDYCKQAAIDWYRGVRRWIPVHRAAWDYQMGAVPPKHMAPGLFMTGEAFSGNYHLTLYNPRKEDCYCCLLNLKQATDRAFVRAIPLADDLGILGVPDAVEKD